MASPAEVFAEQHRRWGDLYAVNNPLFGREVVVNHPEHVRQVFTGDPDVFYGGAANFALMPVVGDLSVIVLDGRPHHRMRKLLVPAFTGERLAGYATVMHATTERVTKAWPVGKPLSVLPSMQRLTFDVILHTIFGVHEGEGMDRLRAALLALVERAQSPLGMLWLLPAFQKDLGPFTGWAALKRAIAAADEAIYAVIAAARAERGAGEARRDVLAALLGARDDEGSPMSDRELRDQLMTLLLAGHETTAISLAWAVDEIARRPAVLAKIRAEARAADGPGNELPYLDAFIKEVLRLHPVAPLLARRLNAPITLGGYEIAAGTFLVLNAHTVQRHPQVWKDPEAFVPERFLGDKPDPYAWIPFGGGARRCIGMSFALFEMRVVLATMFAGLRIAPHGEPAKLTLRSFFYAPKGGARIVVEAERAFASERPDHVAAP
jgi:cytochrome P450